MRGVISYLTTHLEIIYSDCRMFDEPTDLSPDLEWMLQSDQVDDETPCTPVLSTDLLPGVVLSHLSWRGT